MSLLPTHLILVMYWDMLLHNTVSVNTVTILIHLQLNFAVGYENNLFNARHTVFQEQTNLGSDIYQ
jgi:hypothetical protein